MVILIRTSFKNRTNPLQHACSCREEGCTPLGARLQVVLEGGLVDNLNAFGVPAEGLCECHSGDIKNPSAKLVYRTGVQDSRSQKLLFCSRHLSKMRLSHIYSSMPKISPWAVQRNIILLVFQRVRYHLVCQLVALEQYEDLVRLQVYFDKLSKQGWQRFFGSRTLL